MCILGGNSLCRSLSTGHGSPFMGKHFKCRVYTGGRLSFGGREVEESRLVAGIVLLVRLWKELVLAYACVCNRVCN